MPHLNCRSHLIIVYINLFFVWFTFFFFLARELVNKPLDKIIVKLFLIAQDISVQFKQTYTIYAEVFAFPPRSYVSSVFLSADVT